MQLGLFGDYTVSVAKDKPLRPYQQRVVAEAVSAIGLGKSPLIEMATGTGKTRVGAELVKQLKDSRILWLAHRTELIHQATATLSAFLQEAVGHDLPEIHSGPERVVVASKDTIRQPKRLELLTNFRPFDVIIIDEAHHAAARSYQAIIDAFPAAVRVGLSATPDRFDRARLHCFDTATTPYRIVDAIADSWLVPFKAKRVRVDAVDISGVSLVAGDLAAGELELVMKSEEALHGCAKGLLEYAGHRPTIGFVAGVDQASRLCEILNRYRSLCARFVTGTTDGNVRQSLFRDFGRAYQILINVAVATEGTDLPAAACVAMMRPTKSRGLYAQMLGRGGRPLPGLEGVTADERRLWIRSSGKPDCLVLDFVGNTGRHSLVTAFDIADADAVVAKAAAKRYAEGEVIDVFEALKIEAEREESAKEKRRKKAEADAEQRSKIVASVRLSVTDAQLIGLGCVDKLLEPTDPVFLENLTPGQAQELIRLGLPTSVIDRDGNGKVPTKAQARRMIMDKRQALGYATPKQLDFVKRHRPDLWRADLTKSQAKGIFLAQVRKWNR